MPRLGKLGDYRVEIPVIIRDETKAGAKSVVSNVERMAQQSQNATNRRIQKTATSSLVEAEVQKHKAVENSLSDHNRRLLQNHAAFASKEIALTKQLAAAKVKVHRDSLKESEGFTLAYIKRQNELGAAQAAALAKGFGVNSYALAQKRALNLSTVPGPVIIRQERSMPFTGAAGMSRNEQEARAQIAGGLTGRAGPSGRVGANAAAAVAGVTAAKVAFKELEVVGAAAAAKSSNSLQRILTGHRGFINQIVSSTAGQTTAQFTRLGLHLAAFSGGAVVAGKAAAGVLLKAGDATLKVSGDVSKIQKAYEAFFNRIRSGDKAVASSLKNMGVNVASALRHPQAGFVDFLENLKKIQGASAAANTASNVLGKGMGNLAPALKGVNIELAKGAAAATSSSVGLTAFAAAGGAAIVVALALVAALALAVVGMYKITKAAADYGETIYKAQLQTGLAAESLSVISVWSNESGVSLDKLSMAAARLGMNLEKGPTKAGKEAAQALKTLKINTNELKAAKPEQQVYMVAKAIDNLTTSQAKAKAVTALLGSGFVTSSAELRALVKTYENAAKKADAFGLIISDQQVQLAHDFQVAYGNMGLAVQGLMVQLGTRAIPVLTTFFDDMTKMLFGSKGSWDDWAKFIQNVLTIVAGSITGFSIWLKSGGKGSLAQDIVGAIGSLNARVEQVRKANEAVGWANQVTGKGKGGGLLDYETPKGGGGSKQLTQLQQLQKEYKKLTQDIHALRDEGSKEFILKNQIDDLQNFKSNLEGILKLRREMELPLRQGSLPKTLKDSKDALLAEQRLKSAFDEVTKAVNAQADAEAHLAALRQISVLPVVNALIRAETKYTEGVIARRNAEAELTADIIANARLRTDAETDHVGQVIQAYGRLRLRQGQSIDELRRSSLEAETFMMSQTPEGKAMLEAAAQKRQGATAGQVPAPLVSVAARAASIDKNVAAIARQITGSSVDTADSETARMGLATVISKAGAGGLELGASRVREMAAGVQKEIDENEARLNSGGTEKIISLWQGVAKATEDASDEAHMYSEKLVIDVKGSLTEANEYFEIARNERALGDKAARDEVLINEQRLLKGLRPIEDDIAAMRSAKQVQRMHEERAVGVAIKAIEEDLKNFRKQSADDQVTEQRRFLDAKSEELSLNHAIRQAEDNLANSPLNESLRIQLALIQDINAIRSRDEEAIKEYNRATLEMADATVYHADQSDAAVAKFLASQKSVTDIVNDAKIGIMQGTFDLIDKGIGKITAKFGFLKNILNDILASFIKLALSKFFQTIFLGGGGAKSVGGGGGGNFLSNIIGSIFRPQGGSGITGGFAGGPGAAQFPGVGGGNAFGGVSMPSSVTGGLPAARTMEQIIGKLTGLEGGGGPGTGAASGAGRLGGLAGMLPMLGLTAGMSLGAGLGAGSGLGSILGGLGGAGIGGALGMAAFTAMGGTVSASMAGFMAIAGPAALIAGPLLLIGAFILGRNARRRKEEESRNQATIDTRSALYAILAAVSTDQMPGDQARAEIQRLHTDWIAFGNTLKDGKTRRHHMATWDHFKPIIDAIETQIGEQVTRANARARMSPVFAGGGYSHNSQLIKVRPGEGVQYPGTTDVIPIQGRDLGYDSKFMYAPRGTRIINQSDMKRSVGFEQGGTVGSNLNGDLPELKIDKFELNIDADGLADIVISSPHFKTATIKNVKLGRRERKL